MNVFIAFSVGCCCKLIMYPLYLLDCTFGINTWLWHNSWRTGSWLMCFSVCVWVCWLVAAAAAGFIFSCHHNPPSGRDSWRWPHHNGNEVSNNFPKLYIILVWKHNKKRIYTFFFHVFAFKYRHISTSKVFEYTSISFFSFHTAFVRVLTWMRSISHPHPITQGQISSNNVNNPSEEKPDLGSEMAVMDAVKIDEEC